MSKSAAGGLVALSIGLVVLTTTLVNLGALDSATAKLAELRATPTAVPAPSPTPDVPQLSQVQVLSLVSQTLQPEYKGLVAGAKPAYLGGGRWQVKWLGREWEVTESDKLVYGLNPLARYIMK